MRLTDEEGLFQRATEDGNRTTPPLIELKHLPAATRAVETNTETAADSLICVEGEHRLVTSGRNAPLSTEDGRLSIGKFPSVADERASRIASTSPLDTERAALGSTPRRPDWSIATASPSL